MVREIGTSAVVGAVREGARVIDVREPAEYAVGHVPGSVNIPLAQLPTRMQELGAGAPVIVICASGARSLQAAQLLTASGIDASSVAGGTAAWSRAGNPLATGTRADVA